MFHLILAAKFLEQSLANILDVVSVDVVLLASNDLNSVVSLTDLANVMDGFQRLFGSVNSATEFVISIFFVFSFDWVFQNENWNS